MRILLLALVACGGTGNPDPLDPDRLRTSVRREAPPAGHDVMEGDWLICDDEVGRIGSGSAPILCRQFFGAFRFDRGVVYSMSFDERRGCFTSEEGTYDVLFGGTYIDINLNGQTSTLPLTFYSGAQNVRVGLFRSALFLQRPPIGSFDECLTFPRRL